jgi:ribosomal protein S18 acetylase RimI-like enzyme
MSDPSEVFVKRAGADEAALVGEILGEAFGADPITKWISPNPEYPRWCWPVAVSLLLPDLEVYLTENGLGAAMWLPPGAKLNIRPSLAMLWDSWRRFGIGSIIRFFQLMRMMEKHHPGDDHYYLFAIGVRSGSRGQGIGSALLKSVLQKCDHKKVGAYLENSNSLNLPFYQRHGFELRNEIAVPHNGPSLFLMYREPQEF